MRRLTISFFLLSAITLLTIGCEFSSRISVEIPDVSKEWKKEVLVKIPEGEHVHKLKINVHGNSTKDFMLNGKKIEAGNINITLRNGDYYGSDYYIDYKPLEVNNVGSLTIHLAFYY